MFITSDSFVRVVDAFVDAIDLKSFGFSHVDCQEEGRPLYHPYIDAQTSEYEAQLDAADKIEDKNAIEEKIEERKEKQVKYTGIKEELEQSGEEQISLTDPNSRAVILQRNIVNVGYNVQASSDSKHKFLTEFSTGSVNDSHALAEFAIATKELPGVEQITVLADKGYHTGAELSRCE